MIVDDIIELTPDLKIDNLYFRDATIFKFPDEIITSKDVYQIADTVKNYYKEGWNVGNIAKSKNLFNFDLSKPPYDNVIYFHKTENRYLIYWLIKLKEIKLNQEVFSHFIMTPLHMKNIKIILPWVSYEETVPNDVYRIDFLQKNSDLSVDMANITIKYFSGKSINYDDSTRARQYLFVSTLLKMNSLLNCVNIIKIKNSSTKELQKSRIRRGKLPIQSYYTLELKGVSKKYESMMNKQDPQWANRIHLCRGHFKKYTEEKPLLGKYIGLWWWQPCVRGRNKKGVIYKTYELTK